MQPSLLTELAKPTGKAARLALNVIPKASNTTLRRSKTKRVDYIFSIIQGAESNPGAYSGERDRSFRAS